MNSKITKNSKIISNLLVFFSICLVVVTFSKVRYEYIFKMDTKGLEKVELLASSIQRISKFELEKNYDDSLTSDVDEVFAEIFSLDIIENIEYLENLTKLENLNISELDLDDLSLQELNLLDKVSGKINYFNTNKQVIINLLLFESNLFFFKEAVVNFRNETEGSRENLFEISERNFDISENLVFHIVEHLYDLKYLIKLLGQAIFINVMIIGVLLIQKLKYANLELIKSQETSKEMYIDISTGLYNRSKCQELLNHYINNVEEQRERAIIIFDLNFLKQTNDTLGHRSGDMLISSFAMQLKEAKKIFPYDIFLARYGGDEFMAYFSSVQEKDIKIYLKELNFLVSTFNETANKPFTISYAVGYFITTENTKSMTIQELFDVADENMYKNKLEMKLKNMT